MSSTTVPTTLDEYQEYVRKEALKIQLDMGWPDEKLNATLRALGLPEKMTYNVPIEVTGKMFVLLKVDDAMSEEEARASVDGKDDTELRRLITGAGVATGYFSQMEATVLSENPPIKAGAFDSTGTNGSVARANNHGRLCEQYSPNDRHYCTRPRDHDGDHAQGDGYTIQNVWANAA